ncbi:hypothetical protein GCM10027057_01550 [Marisediminicola antarctica]
MLLAGAFIIQELVLAGAFIIQDNLTSISANAARCRRNCRKCGSACSRIDPSDPTVLNDERPPGRRVLNDETTAGRRVLNNDRAGLLGVDAGRQTEARDDTG